MTFKMFANRLVKFLIPQPTGHQDCVFHDVIVTNLPIFRGAITGEICPFPLLNQSNDFLG